jgi:3-hydroxy-9,10-secoandrosta-1,3,5(10)-triene-9,17-dione monooxygenase reductase component
VTIHSTDPFETPGGERSPVRRFRGRLPSAVTLWTAEHGGRRAGLTVSSTVVVDGDPGRLLGVLDEESELYEAVLGSGRFVVMPLRESDSRLADTFAGLMPAPGGPFAGHPWQDTEFGPVLAGAAYAGCTLDQDRAFGWGRLIEATLHGVELTEMGGAPLVHHRGRYVRLG